MIRLKQLVKDSTIYGVGGLLAKAVSFLLLPIYTSIFSVADYGTIEMLSVMSSFLSAILTLGMDSAQSMFFFKYKEQGKKKQSEVVSSILQWRIIWGALVVFLASLSAPLLSSFFFNGKLTWEIFSIAFIGALLSQILYQSAEVMRLLYRPWGYIGVTLGQSILSAALILLCVTTFDKGVSGFFIGSAIASCLVGVIGWLHIRDYLSLSKLHWQLWPEVLRFSVPLLPAGIAMYFMATSDRWFVQYYHGEEALGIFAIGAKFAMFFTIAVETFRKAWWPIAIDAMHSDDGPETFRLITRLYTGIGCASILILTMASAPLVKLLTHSDFYSAWPIIGVLAWQGFFFGLFLVAAAGIWKAERTSWNFYINGATAVVGVIMNQVLVPQYGAMGAAVATAVTYAIWIAITMVISDRFWPIGLPYKILFVQFSVTALLGTLLTINHDTQYYIATVCIALATISLLLYSSLSHHYWCLVLTKVIKVIRHEKNSQHNHSL